MYRNFRIGTLLTGLALGVLPLLLLTTVTLTELFFVAFVFAGLTAGATSSLGVDRISLYLYMLPVLLPLTFCFLGIGGFMPTVMAMMIPLYMGYMILNSNRYLSRLTENVMLREDAQKNELELSRRQHVSELIVKIQAAYLDNNLNQALMATVVRELIKLSGSDFGFICQVRQKSANEMDSIVLVNLGEIGLDRLQGEGLKIDELNMRPLTLEAYFSQVVLGKQEIEVDHIEIMQGKPLKMMLGNFYGFPLKSEGKVIGVIGLIFAYTTIPQGLTELLLPLLHSFERILIGKQPDRRREER